MPIARTGRIHVGVDASPFRREIKNENLLDTDEAALFLRENGYRITATTLISRRTFGKAPAFLKIDGVAVRYRESDLRAFLRTAGLSAKDFDAPKREPRMTESEKQRLSNGKK
jgi:hypothetical protein